MNFLAHLFLGRDTDDLLVGSYLGDFVKGEINGELPTDITRGILLHRHIDSFTDRHPLHKNHRRLFRGQQRRYAGVILDVAYDHFLSRNWSEITDISRKDFINQAYTVLQKPDYQKYYSTHAKRFLQWMTAGDALNRYHHLEGIDHSLQLMSRRGRGHPVLVQGGHTIREHYAIFQEDVPALIREVMGEFKM